MSEILIDAALDVWPFIGGTLALACYFAPLGVWALSDAREQKLGLSAWALVILCAASGVALFIYSARVAYLVGEERAQSAQESAQ